MRERERERERERGEGGSKGNSGRRLQEQNGCKGWHEEMNV
jgi:hypothetical protein